MAILVQREKGNKSYEEVGHEHPLAVQLYQGEEKPLIWTNSPVWVTDKLLVPGIGTAAAYLPGDAFGTKFYFTVPAEGLISNINFLDFDDEGSQKDFVLFSEDFTATADNAAFNVSDDDLLNCLGVISVTTFFNFGANQLGTGTPAFGYKTPNRRLYCQIVTQGTDNIAAGAIPRVFLVVA